MCVCISIYMYIKMQENYLGDLVIIHLLFTIHKNSYRMCWEYVL